MKYYRPKYDWEKESQFLHMITEEEHYDRIRGEYQRDRTKLNSVRGQRKIEKRKREKKDAIFLAVNKVAENLSWQDKANIINNIMGTNITSDAMRKKIERLNTDLSYNDIDYMLGWSIDYQKNDRDFEYRIEYESFYNIKSISEIERVVEQYMNNQNTNMKASYREQAHFIYFCERCEKLKWKEIMELWNEHHTHEYTSADAMRKAYNRAKKKAETDVDLQKELEWNEDYQSLIKGEKTDWISKERLITKFKYKNDKSVCGI